MKDQRVFLPIGTTVELDNDVYKITGEPIGCGGGSILYPAQRQFVQNGVLQTDGIMYVLKECYPAASSYSYTRRDNGEIIPVYKNTEDMIYLQQAQLMQLEEETISKNIYRTASRMLPIRSSAQSVGLTLPGQKKSSVVPNTMTLMDSLAEKGQSLTAWIKQKRRFAPAEAFRIIQQVLFALQEVHEAGYLHLDIQDGNIFFRGSLEQKNEMATLIDFGCARKLINGKTEPIRDKVIFTTQGFSAPEILLHNDGNLQLGPEADLYSVGCLALYLLTGQRANVRELIANRTGVYLRSNQLRRIQCPKHLIGTMQRILARALAKEPENRYHSVEDMLDEVTPLTEALQPKSTILGAVKYDAFVCYKHGSIDSVAALTLQRALENYRAPKGVADKRRPFERVFVDEGELSSCADFGQQIRDALKNSEWLIVICSPDTPSSPWVQLEIDTFLEYHDCSRILAVLTGGNPEISFPPQLKGDTSGVGEVFAAPALSSTPQEAEKQLKGDALLKIAAPMLNTTFDTLKQRQKIYRLQRIAAITAGFLLASVGFAAYAMNRAKVIAEQTARIEEEYERSLINESMFLTEQAEKRLEENDSIGAVELLLHALPTEELQRPVLAKAEALLGEALGVYKAPFNADFSVEASKIITTDCQDFFLHRSGNYLIAWSSSKDIIQVWSTKTMSLVSEVCWDEDQVFNIYENIQIPNSNKIIIETMDHIICFDFLSGRHIWKSESNSIQAMCLTEDGTQLILLRGSPVRNEVELEILSVETGQILHRVSLLMEETHSLLFPQLCISSDNKWIAFTAEGASRNSSLYILNTETDSFDLLFDSDTTIYSFVIDKNCVAVMRLKDNNQKSYENTMMLESYDCSTLQNKWAWKQEFLTDTLNTGTICLISNYEKGNTASAFLFAYSDKSILVDLETGKLIQHYSLQSPFVRINCYDGGFTTINHDGSLNCIDYGETTQYPAHPFIGEDIVKAYQSDNNFYIQKDYWDNEMKIQKYISGRYDYSYESIFEKDGGSYFSGKTNSTDNKNGNSVIWFEDHNYVYFLNGTEQSYLKYPRPDDFSGSVIFSDGEMAYWVPYETYYQSLRELSLYVQNLSTGEIRRQSIPLVNDLFTLDGNMLVTKILPNGDKFVIIAEQIEVENGKKAVYCWNLNDNSLVELYNYVSPELSSGILESYIESVDGSAYLYMVTHCEYYPVELIRLNLQNCEAIRISIEPFVRENDDQINDIHFHWNSDGTQVIFGYSRYLFVINKDGELAWSASPHEGIFEVFFSPDDKDAYVCTLDGFILRYRIADGVCTNRFHFGEVDSELISLVEWMFLSETELLTIIGTEGILLDISGETISLKYIIPDCIGYDKSLGKFFVSNIRQIGNEKTAIGTFPLYTTEDLINKANKLLNES